MTETTLNDSWSLQIQGVGLALALIFTSASITQSESSLNCFSPSLTRDSIISAPAASKSSHLIGEVESWEELRILHIKSLRGKYKNKLTPSEEFARNKNFEIVLEG